MMKEYKDEDVYYIKLINKPAQFTGLIGRFGIKISERNNKLKLITDIMIGRYILAEYDKEDYRGIFKQAIKGGALDIRIEKSGYGVILLNPNDNDVAYISNNNLVGGKLL